MQTLTYPFLNPGKHECVPKGWRLIMSSFYQTARETCDNYCQNPKDATYKRKVYAQIHQAKEKYGSLRIEWGKIEVKNDRNVVLFEHGQQLSKQLWNLSQEAEELSTKICQDCSYSPATLNVDEIGWYQTLCKKCRARKNIYKPKKLKID